MPAKKNKGSEVDKMTGQKKNKYEVLDGSTPGGKESHGEEPPWYACDRKRCLNGRCGVCWLVILGVSIAVGLSCILIFADALGFTFSTDGNETLYDLICDSCTFEPTSDPTSTPTVDPTADPTGTPTGDPTLEPTGAPSVEPTIAPTGEPTLEPSGVPSVEPTAAPTDEPTGAPTSEPTVPTSEPTGEPTSPTNEPTSEPTADPTAEPTSERRRDYKSDMTPNVLLLIANGTGNAEFHTPGVENFLKEGYTFKNLTKKHSLNSLITGRMVMQKGFTWVEQLRSLGYINHYYGSWIFGTGMEALNFGRRGWNNYGAINNRVDHVVDEVQSAISTLKEEKWSITVGLTKSDAYTGFHHHSKNASIYEVCSRYFRERGPDFDHDLGVSCQRSMKYDEKIGEVLQTLRSAEVWKRTIVVLVIIGDQQNMFSISGGALPSKFLNTTNKDLHSFLDVVPTILSVAGFSDFQLQLAKLKGLPVISLNHSPAKVF